MFSRQTKEDEEQPYLAGCMREKVTTIVGALVVGEEHPAVLRAAHHIDALRAKEI
jgi:hypothetical protein